MVPAHDALQLDGVDAMAAKVTIDGECWQHTHSENFDVRDLSYWSMAHDGNDDARTNGNPNPISKWAIAGLYELHFPSHHLMTRWSSRKKWLPLVGRLGDQVDFSALPTSVQTEEMAEKLNAIAHRPTDGAEACGSPGEVASVPTLGNRYRGYITSDDQGIQSYENFISSSASGKAAVWTNVVLSVDDQLRQRMAWALSQVVVVGADGTNRAGYNEVWHVWYDM